MTPSLYEEKHQTICLDLIIYFCKYLNIFEANKLKKVFHAFNCCETFEKKQFFIEEDYGVGGNI